MAFSTLVLKPSYIRWSGLSPGIGPLGIWQCGRLSQLMHLAFV